MDEWYAGLNDLNAIAVEISGHTTRVGSLGSAVVRKAARDVEAWAKRFAPVDTGALKNSIGTDIMGDARQAGIQADIGPTVNYAPFVEWGTRRMAPRAFMGPAMDRVEPGFLAACEQLANPLGGNGG